jgi:hypothetical protein
MHAYIFRRALQLGLLGFIAVLVVLGLALARITEPSVAADTRMDSAAQPAPAEERRNAEANPPDEHRAKAACATCGRVELIRVAEVSSRDGAAEKRTAYRVTVRMEDGSFRTISQRAPPSVVIGERVRIADGSVIPARDMDR